jgi:hypothetical protein
MFKKLLIIATLIAVTNQAEALDVKDCQLRIIEEIQSEVALHKPAGIGAASFIRKIRGEKGSLMLSFESDRKNSITIEFDNTKGRPTITVYIPKGKEVLFPPLSSAISRAIKGANLSNLELTYSFNP